MTKSILEIAKECGIEFSLSGVQCDCYTYQLEAFATKLREEAKAEQIERDAAIVQALPNIGLSAAEAAEAILAQLPPPPAQREGSEGDATPKPQYRLVPIEPTPAQLQAINAAYWEIEEARKVDRNCAYDDPYAVRLYKAGVAAAPEPKDDSA